MTTPGAAASTGPKLLDRVREAIRLRHYSSRTEAAYVAWIRRFILFHGRRHLQALGDGEVTAFLSALAQRGLSASSQNQALGALLFLYQVVFGQRLRWMGTIVPAQRPPGCRSCCHATSGGAALAARWDGLADGFPDVRCRSAAAGVCDAAREGRASRSR